MWSVGSERAPHAVYLGTQAVACADGRGWHAAVNGLDDALAQLVQHLRSTRSRWLQPPLQLWLSGALCRPFLMAQPAGRVSQADWTRIAAAMAPAQTGLDGPCRVWLAPCMGPGPRLAVAVLDQTIQACEAAARGGRRRLVAAMPWWAGVLNAALKSDTNAPLELLGVHEGDALTVLGGDQGEQGGHGGHGGYGGYGGRSGFGVATTYAPLVDEASASAAWWRAVSGQSASGGRVLRVQFSLRPAGQSTAPDAGEAGLQMRWAQVQS